MARRSRRLEDESRRFRTLLQSLDTARYQRDRAVDRKTDIDQARTEILSSILFGHEVIIPAGVVADCPAAHVLLPEVLEHFQPARRRIEDYTGRRYFPFRIGVERRFAAQDPRGYDAFVRDYVADERNRLVELVELGRLSERDKVRQTVVRLADAYLARKWNEIRALDSKFGDYMELVYENFGEISDRTPRPVVARDGTFTTAPKHLYSSFIRDCCANLEARKVEYEKIDAVRTITGSLRQRMSDGGFDSGQRGSWYGMADAYEALWIDIRGWFDHALYTRLARAFAVDIPSYFTQEVSEGGVSREVSLAYLDAPSLSHFRSDVEGGKLALPPAAAKVNWAAIWQTVSERDVQDRIRHLHLKLVDARDIVALKRREARDLDEASRAAAEDQIVPSYRMRSADAIEAHIAFLNSGQSGLIFRVHNGRLMVDARLPKEISKTQSRLEKMFDLGVAITTDMALHTPGLITYPLLIGEGIAADSVSRKVVRTLIDYVRRPSNASKTAASNFYSAERNRVNYWFSTN